jgi:leader peptidase (prepilin peptidase)/N-methyltransferase
MSAEIISHRYSDLVILIFFLAPILFHDIRDKKIPDVFVIPAIVIFTLKRIFERNSLIPLIFLQGLVGFTFFFILYLIFKGKIGLGDAKLSALLAIVLGLKGWLIALILASISGLIYGLIKIKVCAMKKDEKIPYAPFLIIGCIISIFLKDIFIEIW